MTRRIYTLATATCDFAPDPAEKTQKDCHTANPGSIFKNFKKCVRYTFNHIISVNALCINQNDNDEKGEQVRPMKDVYISSNKDFEARRGSSNMSWLCNNLKRTC